MKGGFGNTLPVQATDAAASWDTLYIFLTVISFVFFVLVIGAMVYFAVKYRQGKKADRAAIEGNVPLEIIWTIIPTILLLFIFAWGWVVYQEMVVPNPNAMEVKVIGKQWSWQFIYEDGRTTNGEVYVPVDRPVKFLMTSDDVLHSFFIPNFRIKQDVVPGMYTYVTFQATVPGEHVVFCAEYCGAAHSGMLAKLKVLTAEQWTQWQRGKEVEVDPVSLGKMKAPQPETKGLSKLAKKGELLMQTKGCIACHTTDGTKKIGPSYKGLYGSEAVLQDGTKVKVDENYIRESIEMPQAKIVQGYPPVMPTFKGQITEQELISIIEYIKTVK